MTEPTLLQAAVDELYAAPSAEFTTRRKDLAAAARKAGDRGAAAAIAALRKPTLSADTVNQLVRGAPQQLRELLTLGADLRAAEQALDAPRLRTLSQRRRSLIADLADLAFELTGQDSPSATVRDEVTGTLNAALADKQVADRLVTGALITRASWDGFGSASLPELAAALPSQESRRPPPAVAERSAAARPPAKPAAATTGKATKATQAAPATGVAQGTDSATAAEAEARKAAAAEAGKASTAAKVAKAQQAARAEAQRQRLAAAQQQVADATAAATDAQHELDAIDRRISELNLQLAHQRQLLAAAQRSVKDAQARRRAAQLAATRAGAGS